MSRRRHLCVNSPTTRTVTGILYSLCGVRTMVNNNNVRCLDRVQLDLFFPECPPYHHTYQFRPPDGPTLGVWGVNGRSLRVSPGSPSRSFVKSRVSILDGKRETERTGRFMGDPRRDVSRNGDWWGLCVCLVFLCCTSGYFQGLIRSRDRRDWEEGS